MKEGKHEAEWRRRWRRIKDEVGEEEETQGGVSSRLSVF